MRFMATSIIAVMLSGCVTAQSAAVPPNPDAPFPLANSVIVGQPQPGTLLVEERDIVVNRATVRRAGREWCAGPATVSPIRIDRNNSRFGRIRATWLVRCQ